MKISKIYLLLFTIIYFIIMRAVNTDYIFVMGIYLIPVGAVKGLLSEKLRDVFNFKKTKYLYEKNGFTDSLMELLSLLLIFVWPYLIDEPFSFIVFVFLLFLIALIYRFLFWGITRTIREKV